MRLSPGLTRGRRRALGLAVLAGLLVVTAGSFARASGAGGTAVDQAVRRGRVSDGRGRPVVGLPALPGLEPGGHGSAQPDGRRSRRVARQEPGRDDVGVRRRHRRAARLPRQARLPAGLDRPDVGRRREGAGRDGRHVARGEARDAPGEDGKRRARRAASARPRRRRSRSRAPTTTRASSGTWLSVEAKSSAAQGNAAVPPGSPGCPTTGSNRCGVYGGSTTGACWGNPAGGASALSTAACPALNVTYSTDNGADLGDRLPDEHAGRTSTTASTSTTSSWSSWPSRPTTRPRRTCRSSSGSRRTTAASRRGRRRRSSTRRRRTRAASSTTSSRATRRRRTARR